ncbi:MAG: hypothetical protein M5U34_33955 [Chloroflexi bacterium]|nr:hypothetical protein [Chloroflexota bacterium]
MVSNAKVVVGDVVKIHNWYGVVFETHFDANDVLSIIQVQTARNIFRGHGPEYIDVRMMPDAIQAATLADLEHEIQNHQRLLNGALERMLFVVNSPELMLAEAD